MKKILATVALIVVSGCSSSSSAPVGVDMAADLAAGVDLTPLDLTGEPADLGSLDQGRTVDEVLDFGPSPDEKGEPLCEAGEGCFLDPCGENGECQSGFCVEHMGESVCTIQCSEECPPGWGCQQIGAGPDLAFVCVSRVANLCKPCAQTGDCKSPGGADDVCLGYGDEGRFCGAQCTSDADCPWGFSCVETLTVDGVETKQCVADAGICPCTNNSVELGLSTPCERSNEFGSCGGKRVCQEGGLSDCDALTPAKETCNGLDDDCDGFVDEPDEAGGEFLPLCDDGNPCSKDLCNGETGCSYEELDAGECLDGDACTIGDHCAAGVCVGSPIACDDGNPCTDDTCDGLGGCQHLFNAADCDDKDPCTVADECNQGECAGVAVACDCLTDADCAVLEDGDLCNGTLECNTETFPYHCQVAAGTPVLCSQPTGPGSFCLSAVCDPETGVCTQEPAHDGFACDDGNACSLGEVCAAGVCGGAGSANCADDNPCTEDFCDPQTGCLHQNNQLPCNDGNACTKGDSCAAGVCVGGADVMCDDGNDCTADSCDAQSGCQYLPTAGDCDDGNACTLDDTCMAGKCVAGKLQYCDDDNPCTKDTCTPQGGCLNMPVAGACDDNDPCTLNDTCSNGQCVPGFVVKCDDGNPCTSEVCVAGECQTEFLDIPCDDGNACSTKDHCLLGKCQPQGVLDCDDDNPCTTDACDEDDGCVYQLFVGPCEDGDLCTVEDTCINGECVTGPPKDCDDNNVCTKDTCVAGECQAIAMPVGCSDGDACTTGDSCVEGECVASGALECDDDNVCTDDSCDPESGCVYALNEIPCNDKNVCTLGDVCHLGECTAAAQLTCDDKNPCTDDSCDPGVGCEHVPNSAPCSDGNACTTDDACSAGVCVATVNVDCDDGNPCTHDTCAILTGCVNAPQDGICSDGDACTLGDFCAEGSCQPGAGALACDDGNPCTDDSCAPDKGCVYEPNTEACDDNNACTQNDVCGSGSCQPGEAVVCPSDNKPCTTDSCDPDQGCIYTPITPCCGNGDQEAGEACDDGNNTNGDGCDANCVSEHKCTDVGGDKLIYVSELNACLSTLGAQFASVQWIEVAYGNTSYLTNICKEMGYSSYSTTHGGDKCSSSANMYPSHCNQGWLGGACHNGCGNTNYDGFYCN